MVFVLSYTHAQVAIPGVDRIDKFNDTTTLALYSSILQEADDRFKLMSPVSKLSYNSLYPRGYNDGPIWKGKGLTLEVHGGFQANIGKMSVTLHPVAFFSENLYYLSTPTAHLSSNVYAYQFSNRIDWVQRYGNNKYIRLHPGQSELKMDWGKIATSLSTQNYSLGPSVYNPILLSRQGEGFPHFRIGLKPTQLKIGEKNIGQLETNLIFGLLSESEYFDSDADNDTRYFNGLTIAYSPNFLPELSVGINKVLYKQTEFFELVDLFSTVYIADDGVIEGGPTSGNDFFDQMASIFMNWDLKKSGFRAYAEFAKNDFTTDGDFRFFALEPEHARAYTIGFEKRLRSKKNNEVRITYEHTNLSKGQSFQKWRADPAWYAHNFNTQGYTQNGQIIGAGIGPGGNSDHLEVSRIGEKINFGMLIQRIEHNKDYFVANIRDFTNHDIEYTLNFFGSKEFPKAIWYGEFGYSYNYNRSFIAFEDQKNIYLSIGSRLKL